MNKIIFGTLFFLGSFLSVAQPKLGQDWKGGKSGETLETPLGFLNKETQSVNKVLYYIGVDKSDKVVYVETRSTTFKVENYSLSTRFHDFKNYNYTRFFDGWGYYLRLNANWCAYFGKSMPSKASKPLLFFNYNFGKAEGKQILDSNYEEVLAAQLKAEKEKKEKQQQQIQAKQQKKEEYEKAQALAKQKEEEAKKAELERKEELKKGLERRKAEEEAKKKAEEERKQKYAKELAEYNAQKEAERKAKEAERIRKSEEFRTGQKIQNIELAEQTASLSSSGGNIASATASKKSSQLTGGEKLLDGVLQSRIKKSLPDYLNYIAKNKKRTEAYPLVLVNYKDITELSSAELIKIKKINSTTFFKKGHQRTEDFKDKGKNGVIIIKAE
ncbi:hypothetical protein [Capnocytophaga catalasegens]|uniref:TolA protein n=1 Tax=Capnocytophaga catalasegens TaxID=1004260 RepID=A0AAV5AWI7_9FLAO|nr:hypothetical protein [Capnocytophaga catalasegens]GIZ14974.1 hypothetical protein RCZ03_09740 [Capnocytophaga catalasegens]GJM49353.1 hypothetical protein RCZ15_03280 [Capnocytophaga catalasegens]GJM52504.1 hypothetical protein RCZ16_08210 [Capnocytophaga catalasegens]